MQPSALIQSGGAGSIYRDGGWEDSGTVLAFWVRCVTGLRAGAVLVTSH